MDGPAISSGGGVEIAAGYVTIGADMSQLRAAEDEARQIHERISRMGANVPSLALPGGVAGAGTTTGGTSAGIGLRVDENAIRGQMDAIFRSLPTYTIRAEIEAKPFGANGSLAFRGAPDEPAPSSASSFSPRPEPFRFATPAEPGTVAEYFAGIESAEKPATPAVGRPVEHAPLTPSSVSEIPELEPVPRPASKANRPAHEILERMQANLADALDKDDTAGAARLREQIAPLQRALAEHQNLPGRSEAVEPPQAATVPGVVVNPPAGVLSPPITAANARDMAENIAANPASTPWEKSGADRLNVMAGMLEREGPPDPQHVSEMLRQYARNDQHLSTPLGAAIDSAGRQLLSRVTEQAAAEKLRAEAESQPQSVAPAVREFLAKPPVPRTSSDIPEEGMEMTVPASALREHGWTAVRGTLDDPQRLENAKRHLEEGQREPVKMVVSPEGRWEPEDGRHRTLAAAQTDKPLRVRFLRGEAAMDDPDATRGVESFYGPQEPAGEQVHSAQRKVGQDQGWKLHLASDQPEEVSKILKAENIRHKVGRSGDQEGKDLTAYIGSRDDAERAARIIEEKAGHLLKPSHGEVLKDDISFTPKVAGRFDIGGGDADFHQYGAKGIPFLNRDMDVFNPVPIEQAYTRADKLLRERYGEFFTGSDPQLPPPASLEHLPPSRQAEIEHRHGIAERAGVAGDILDKAVGEQKTSEQIERELHGRLPFGLQHTPKSVINDTLKYFGTPDPEDDPKAFAEFRQQHLVRTQAPTLPAGLPNPARLATSSAPEAATVTVPAKLDEAGVLAQAESLREKIAANPVVLHGKLEGSQGSVVSAAGEFAAPEVETQSLAGAPSRTPPNQNAPGQRTRRNTGKPPRATRKPGGNTPPAPPNKPPRPRKPAGGGSSPKGYRGQFNPGRLTSLAGTLGVPFAALWATQEAVRFGSELTDAQNIEDHPERIQRGFAPVGSPFDEENDPFIRQQSQTLAGVAATQRRWQAAEGIPLVGSLVQLGAAVGDVHGKLGDQEFEARRAVEREEFLKRSVLQSDISFARMQGDEPGAVAKEVDTKLDAQRIQVRDLSATAHAAAYKVVTDDQTNRGRAEFIRTHSGMASDSAKWDANLGRNASDSPYAEQYASYADSRNISDINSKEAASARSAIDAAEAAENQLREEERRGQITKQRAVTLDNAKWQGVMDAGLNADDMTLATRAQNSLTAGSRRGALDLKQEAENNAFERETNRLVAEAPPERQAVVEGAREKERQGQQERQIGERQRLQLDTERELRDIVAQGEAARLRARGEGFEAEIRMFAAHEANVRQQAANLSPAERTQVETALANEKSAINEAQDRRNDQAFGSARVGYEGSTLNVRASGLRMQGREHEASMLAFDDRDNQIREGVRQASQRPWYEAGPQLFTLFGQQRSNQAARQEAEFDYQRGLNLTNYQLGGRREAAEASTKDEPITSRAIGSVARARLELEQAPPEIRPQLQRTLEAELRAERHALMDQRGGETAIDVSASEARFLPRGMDLTGRKRDLRDAAATFDQGTLDIRQGTMISPRPSTTGASGGGDIAKDMKDFLNGPMGNIVKFLEKIASGSGIAMFGG